MPVPIPIPVPNPLPATAVAGACCARNLELPLQFHLSQDEGAVLRFQPAQLRTVGGERWDDA